jgi:carbon storage regulator
MLVLSRRQGESIVVNNDIVVTVVEIHGDTVRIAVEAPPQIAAHRGEVFDRIHGAAEPREPDRNGP